MTLVSGDFSSRSTNAKNIEVSVRICNENGEVLNNVVTYGAGAKMISDYKSVIYYHEEKPRWMETFKISIPVENFHNLHIKFTFKHRSSVESKDKERPFAYAYIKLMNENGTTIKDKQHNLIIYKVDAKKFENNSENVFKYLLSRPSTKSEIMNDKQVYNSNRSLTNGNSSRKTLERSISINSNNLNIPGLSMNQKDSFLIDTVICSTKLTQNIDLLGLLKWRSRKSSSDEELKDCLTALMKVDGEEIVKFLQDTLDSLFHILMIKDTDEFNYLVFEALVFIIGLISDHKYQNFRPVLNVYIQESFSATLAYNKLIYVLINFIDSLTEGRNLIEHNASTNMSAESFNLRAMKCLEFIFKFIVKSRYLFASLNRGKKEKEFENSMTSLLTSISKLLSSGSNATIIVQGSCLKYLPHAISDILTVFDSKKLSSILINIINNVPVDKLRTQKMFCILDILHCQNLFNDTECRMIFLPVFNKHIKLLMKSGDFTNSTDKTFSVSSDGESRKQHEEELNICIKVLKEMLSCLYKQNKQSVFNEINDLIKTLLPTLIQVIIETERSDKRISALVSILIEIFRQMTSKHFDNFIEHLLEPNLDNSSNFNLLIFLTKVLKVFKDLAIHPVYTSEWIEMIMVQNTVILSTLRLISEKMKSIIVGNSFDKEIYNNFFQCAIAFLTQKSLQLENFSANKRNRLILKYKDMRKETANLIRQLWFFLKDKRTYFIPNMVGSILEMSLIPELEIRKIGLRIYFDMMEFEHMKLLNTTSADSIANQDSLSKSPPAVFSLCEQELILQLDKKLESGKGDYDFKDLFFSEIGLLSQGSTIKEQGTVFVKTAVRLMKSLLEYRNVINCSSTSENNDQISLCLMNIIEFFQKQNQQELYLRYLYKLCDLQLKCENYCEAAYVLKLHADLLKWSDDLLNPTSKSEKYPYLEKHRELKEKLYLDIIDYFDKGKLWEEGLNMCKELASEYENETFDFNQLSNLHLQMSTFYDNIMKQIRPKQEYYRVSFYGKGFIKLLQNKTFIYRGKPYENWYEFKSNLLIQFPNATEWKKLVTPGPEYTNAADVQIILINQVDPEMNEQVKEKFQNKHVNLQIQQYYETNKVQKFSYSRKYQNDDDEGDQGENEFANMWRERTYLQINYPLPGILTWFPVCKTSTYILSPIEIAIETMEKSNSKLKTTIIQHINDSSLQIVSLSMILKGILDPAVNGGFSKYEEVFFTKDYLHKHNNSSKEELKINELKTLIAEQIPLLEVGIQVHRERVDAQVQPLHDRLEELFAKMKETVQRKYGVMPTPSELEQFNKIKLRNLETKNRHLNRYSGTDSQNQSIHQTHSTFDLAKHGSMLSLTNTVKKTKSAFVRNSGGSNGHISLNSNTLHSLINSGTQTLTKLKHKHKEHSNSLMNYNLIHQQQQNGHSNVSSPTVSLNPPRKANLSQSQFYIEESEELTNNNNNNNNNNTNNNNNNSPVSSIMIPTPNKAKSTNDLRNGAIVLREQLKAQRPQRPSNSRPSSGSNYLSIYRNSLSHGNSSTSLSPQCSEPDSKSEESTASNSLTNILNNNNNNINLKTTNSPSSSLPFSNQLNDQINQLNNQICEIQLNSKAQAETIATIAVEDNQLIPPALPKKCNSTIINNNSKYSELSPLKQRNSCSNIKKKMPPPLPSNNSLSSLNTIVKLSTNGENDPSVYNYEYIPPIKKKIQRPIPALPQQTNNENKSIDLNGTNNS